MFGPPDNRHVFCGVEFRGIRNPCISDPTQRNISIQLPEDHAGNAPLLRWHIAHECVHLVDPHNDPTNVLEEGIAVWYQNKKVSDELRDEFRDKTGGYRRAEVLVGPNITKLLAVKDIRKAGVKIEDIDWCMLMEYTQIDYFTCRKLCERFPGSKPW